MSGLNVLIVGCGIAGPALAAFLLKSDPNYRITVVERSSTLRTAGQQIDIRSYGIPIMRKFGLLDTVRARRVDEPAVNFIDESGRVWASFGRNESSDVQTASSEYEIMRGDLVDVLYQASLDAARDAKADIDDGNSRNHDNINHINSKGMLKYVFDISISSLQQDDDGVDVVFTNGNKGRYDLVIGADGQGSRTRRLVFGEDASRAAFNSLGVFIAFYSFTRGPQEPPTEARGLWLPNRRVIFTRGTADRPSTQIYLAIIPPTGSPAISELRETPLVERKAIYRRLFEDAGWRVPYFLDKMDDSGDFYAQEIGQVKMSHWTKGRVALLGDAGYCPSSHTGMGTTLGLLGAYVLAGELARHGMNKGGVKIALQEYEKTLRPFVQECQSLPPGVPGLVYPKTWWGVRILLFIAALLAWLRIDQLFVKLHPFLNSSVSVPEYPELGLGQSADAKESKTKGAKKEE